MAYRDLVSEIVGTIPRISYPLAQKYLARSWQQIQDMRLWSFLIGTGDIITPAEIHAGAITVQFGSNIVQMNAEAAAALQPAALTNPPLAYPQLGVGRQLRFGGGGASPIYSIIAADFDPSANTLTLDRNYAGETLPLQPYRCYKCYYAPPSLDFLRYLTVTNMRAGYTIRGKGLYLSQQRLNAVDPQRGSNGDAYRLSPYRAGFNGMPITEWYPHPVNPTVYNCFTQLRWPEINANYPLPATFPEGVLLSHVLAVAAGWALANVGSHPELAQTNWVMFAQTKRAEFKEGVIQAIKQDDEIMPLAPFIQGPQSGYGFPLGGEFVQGHDLSGLLTPGEL
jgi:hypothetical protein